jgi:hypothetical protein
MASDRGAVPSGLTVRLRRVARWLPVSNAQREVSRERHRRPQVDLKVVPFGDRLAAIEADAEPLTPFLSFVF